MEYLRNLPSEVTVDLTDKIKVHCFHATPESLFEVVKPTESDKALEEKLMQNQEADIYLYGHIHLPYVRYINGKLKSNWKRKIIPNLEFKETRKKVKDAHGEG